MHLINEQIVSLHSMISHQLENNWLIITNEIVNALTTGLWRLELQNFFEVFGCVNARTWIESDRRNFSAEKLARMKKKSTGMARLHKDAIDSTRTWHAHTFIFDTKEIHSKEIFTDGMICRANGIGVRYSSVQVFENQSAVESAVSHQKLNVKIWKLPNLNSVLYLDKRVELMKEGNCNCCQLH